MKWNWRLGKVLGIDLIVHSTFFVLLAFVGIFGLLRGGLPELAAGVVLTLLVFAVVVLHELGHAMAARAFGIPTRDITLLPIGGVARLERMPSVPRQELIVALAGPAVNGVLAVICLAGLGAAGALSLSADGLLVSLLTQLLWINVTLGAFNLLPAFPMDGGRALRALLATRLGKVQATDTAARVGRGFAVAFGVLGLFTNPFLILIGIFVWFAGKQEAQQVRSEQASRSMGWRTDPHERVVWTVPQHRITLLSDSRRRESNSIF